MTLRLKAHVFLFSCFFVFLFSFSLFAQLKEASMFSFERGLNGFDVSKYNDAGSGQKIFINTNKKFVFSGKQSLGVQLDLVGTKKEQRFIASAILGERTWYAKTLSIKVWLPEEMKGSRFLVFFQSAWWANWAQTKDYNLNPGWNTIKIDLVSMSDIRKGIAGKDYTPPNDPARFVDEDGNVNRFRFKIDFNKMSTLGFTILYTPDRNVKTTYYIDEVTFTYDPKDEKIFKLANTVAKKWEKTSVSLNAGLYGGIVNKNVMAFNLDSIGLSDDFLKKKLKDAGTGLVRTWAFGGYDQQMTLVNPKEGVYHWEDWDKLIKAIYDAGWEPLITLGECPAWNGKPKGPPLDYEKWADMAAAFVQHFNKDLGYNIKYWEIWNEPEYFWLGSEKEYNKLVAIAAPKMKQVDPKIKIMAGAWANPNNIRVRLPRLLDSVDLNAIDLISYHHYLTWPGTSDHDVMQMTDDFEYPPVMAREIFKAMGIKKKLDVMMTEANVQASGNWDPRILTVFWPVYWASSLTKFIRQNVPSAVYFTFSGTLFGAVEDDIRPIYNLWPLLQKKARILGKRWVYSKSDSAWLETMGFIDANHFSIMVVNKNTEGNGYETDIKVKGMPLTSALKVWQLSDSNDGTQSVGSVKVIDGKFYYKFPPYSVTVFEGDLSSSFDLSLQKKFQYKPKGTKTEIKTGQDGVKFTQ